jgi:hypothetical protein
MAMHLQHAVPAAQHPGVRAQQRPLLRPRPQRRWAKIAASAAAAGGIAVGTDGLPLPIGRPDPAASALQRFIRWWDVGWRHNDALPPPDKMSSLLKKIGDLVRPEQQLVAIAGAFMVGV